MEIVSKLWGYEEILVNNDKYCAKFLHLTPGWECSLHYHPVKKETFICCEGMVQVDIEAGGLIHHKTLMIGDQLTINPWTPHRFRCADDELAVLLEVSSPHDDNDVVRIQESRPCGPIHMSKARAPVMSTDSTNQVNINEYGQAHAKLILGNSR